MPLRGGVPGAVRGEVRMLVRKGVRDYAEMGAERVRKEVGKGAEGVRNLFGICPEWVSKEVSIKSRSSPEQLTNTTKSKREKLL